jgi:hypothetical protein
VATPMPQSRWHRPPSRLRGASATGTWRRP